MGFCWRQDWNNGVIPYYTMPPVRKSAIEGEAAVVTTWAPGFDVERVFADEASAVIQGLPSLEDTDRAFFEMQTAGPVAMEGVGDEVGAPGKVPGSIPACRRYTSTLLFPCI
jgi:hypothetical protein